MNSQENDSINTSPAQKNLEPQILSPDLTANQTPSQEKQDPALKKSPFFMAEVMPINGPVLEYTNSDDYTITRASESIQNSQLPNNSEYNAAGKNPMRIKQVVENKDLDIYEEKKLISPDVRLRKSNYPASLGDTLISEFFPGPIQEKVSSKSSSNQNLANLVQDTSEDPKMNFSESSSQKSDGDDLRNSDIRALLKKREQQVTKPVCFNIMVAGESGCGKSTFIDAFLNKKYTTNEPIRPSTQEVSEIHDTPGYGRNLEISDWYKKIKEYIINQVHILLYFLSGPRINQKDLIFMKKLKRYCNIVPILAKGDSYTVNEIKEIKLNLIQEAREYDIEWFDFIEALKDTPQKYKEVTDGKFGPSPPFLIITSLTKVQIAPNEYVYGREYTWGICNIENPDHSDFVLLQTLLGGYICLEAIHATNYFYKDYFKTVKERKKLQEEEEKMKTIGVGTLVACGLVGILIAIKKKLLE